ncbi:uncharacterized protein LOC116125468 [Pistacia vera]|uniref:uncharacterized protein LOC116125468 n=1 Tax=Pistacia vera TaxID=55513 RepID=UPI001263E5DF|nr:uncharacterized protein LOC116125468 [Pistacia vera]
MTAYLNLVKVLQTEFKEFSIAQVPRVENTHADALANLGLALQCSSQSSIPLLFLQWNWKEQLINKSPEEVMDIELADFWMTPIVKYLEHNELTADKNEACRLRARAARFTMYEGQLLRKSFSDPYLKGISLEEAKRVLVKLHEGECGNHTGGCSPAHQVITTRYYWPTIHADSVAYVKKCDSCQRFGISKEIVTDNGSQFINSGFRDFCDMWGIKLSFFILRNPQSNGQAESSNKTIMQTLKIRLQKTKGAWADELPRVIWSY